VTLDDDLALAHELADAADEITLARFGAVDLVVEAKPDLTPVSDADRAVEQVVRSTLASRRPGDAVLGEEDGESGTGPRRWVVDPSTGRRTSCRGVPVWATLIALQEDGVVTAWLVERAGPRPAVVGLPGAAPTRRRAGRRARLQVSRGRGLAGRVRGVLLAHRLGRAGPAARSARLSSEVWRTRAYGDFWSHVLVAEGAVDASFEPEVSLWDVARCRSVVEEAGRALHRPVRRCAAGRRQRRVLERAAARRRARRPGGPGPELSACRPPPGQPGDRCGLLPRPAGRRSPDELLAQRGGVGRSAPRAAPASRPARPPAARPAARPGPGAAVERSVPARSRATSSCSTRRSSASRTSDCAWTVRQDGGGGSVGSSHAVSTLRRTCRPRAMRAG
jgi:histidinol-phosphatase